MSGTCGISMLCFNVSHGTFLCLHLCVSHARSAFHLPNSNCQDIQACQSATRTQLRSMRAGMSQFYRGTQRLLRRHLPESWLQLCWPPRQQRQQLMQLRTPPSSLQQHDSITSRWGATYTAILHVIGWVSLHIIKLQHTACIILTAHHWHSLSGHLK